MSTHTDTLRQVRSNHVTVRGRALSPSSKPSSMTQTFFARGEEQEANGYENLAPDDPLLVPPALEFDSFDKIPRRRGSWFAIAVSTLVVLALGFVTWRSFYFLSRPASSVAAASRAMVQAPVSQAPAPMSIAPAPRPAPVMSEAPPASEPPAADQPEATQARTANEPAPQPPSVTKPVPEAVAQPVAAAQPAPVRPQSAPRATADEPVAQPVPVAQPAPIRPQPAPRATADEPVHARRHGALHGYVWSPEKHTLVPAEPAVQDAQPHHAPLRGYVWSPEKHTLVPGEPAVDEPLPREDPGTQMLDGGLGEQPRPQPARERTSPAPFQPAPSDSPVPNTSAPIID